MEPVLHIKNMVCNRCIKVVQEELEKLGFVVMDIDLGVVRLDHAPDTEEKQQIQERLESNGFALIEEKNSRIIEFIKKKIIALVHNDQPAKHLKVNLSDYLSEEIGRDYHYLSSLFSSVEGITIEKYYILQKIERIKELLFYDELTLSEIAYQLGYSSVQHLSGQFKKVIGLSPSQFRKLKTKDRKPLDRV